MQAATMFVLGARRNRSTIGHQLVGVAAATLFVAQAAMAAPGAGGSQPSGKSDAVSFEAIPGSTVKRVILSAKAMERLGIESGVVTKQTVVRTQMVGGRVVTPVDNPHLLESKAGGLSSFSRVAAKAAPRTRTAAAKRTDADETWVLVTLSKAEWERLAKAEPASILPLTTRGGPSTEVMAAPSGMPPHEDPKRSMLKLYYVLPGKDHGFELYHRVRVELPLPGGAEERMVIPYDAIYYGPTGTTWVYVVSKPRVFERRPVEVERVEGTMAILTDGPPIGTSIVTVGVALLYGAEVVFGK